MGNTKKKKTDEETVETVVEETINKEEQKDKEAAKVQNKIEKDTVKQTKDEKTTEEKTAKEAIKKALKVNDTGVTDSVNITETKIVATEFLNVRRSPDASTNQNIIKVIRKGTIVNVTAHFDGVWSVIDFEGGVAYVMSKFIN